MPEKQTGSLRPLVSVLMVLTGCYALGFVGSLAVNRSLDFWYIVVHKPAWAPPGYLLVPVSTVSYGLTGLAIWKLQTFRPGIVCSVLQLALVVLWNWTLFGWQRPLPAVCVAILAWLATLAAALVSRRPQPVSLRLLLPVLLWATYMLALTIAIWRMNRS